MDSISRFNIHSKNSRLSSQFLVKYTVDLLNEYLLFFRILFNFNRQDFIDCARFFLKQLQH